MPILHGHWLFFIVVYINQLRPPVRRELVDQVNLKGRCWDQVTKHALKQKGAEDPHYLKCILPLPFALGFVVAKVILTRRQRYGR